MSKAIRLTLNVFRVVFIDVIGVLFCICALPLLVMALWQRLGLKTRTNILRPAASESVPRPFPNA
jgi:hypothetical protein